MSISQDKTMRFWRQKGAVQVLAEPWFIETQLIKCPDDTFSSFFNTKDKIVRDRIAANHFTAVVFKQDEIDSFKLLAGDLLGNRAA